MASVEALETFFEAHELFDSTLEAKPIEITRQEIYGTLSVLMKHIPVLVSSAWAGPAVIVEILLTPWRPLERRTIL